MGDVEHQQRNVGVAEIVRQAQRRQTLDHRIVEPALENDAHIVPPAVDMLVEIVVEDEFFRRGKPVLDLLLLLHERNRRVGEAVKIEAGAVGLAVEAHARRLIVLGVEFAEHVAGPDAQFEDHRRVRRFGKLEPLFHHVDDRRQIRARIEHPHGALHGERVGALLNDARPFAVILSGDDHRPAGDAGRRKIG